MSEQHIIVFLIQVFILLGLSRFGGELLNRFKQPALTAEIAVGVLLGPTILGRFFPQMHTALFPDDLIQKTMFETIAWLGAFFFLMEAGLEIDFSSAWRQKSKALTIAVMGLLVPFVLSSVCAWFLPDRYLVSVGHKWNFVLFMATVLTVSAMPIAVRALRDLNLTKTDLGFLIMSALSVNDIIGWFLFTVVFGFFIQSNIHAPNVVQMFLEAGGFVVFCLTIGRHFSSWVVRQIKSRRMPEPASSLTFVFLLGLWSGALAQKIGLHALFGFFLAGVMAGEAKDLSEKTRQTIGQMVYALFVPLFFAGIGLKMDFVQYFDPFLVAFVAIVGIGVRFIGAYAGVALAQVPKANRSTIAIAHTPGGMMEIVMGLLALEAHLITPTVFIAIVCGALITAIVMGPWLSWVVNHRTKVSVFEFFTRRGIVMPLKVTLRDEAIKSLCSSAALETGLDEEYLSQIVMERENLMGTAMEEGVAVPHGRVEGLKRPIIIFGRSLAGIDWNSPDGNLSHFIFLILTPMDNDAMQVQILRNIACVMQDKGNAQSVLDAKDAAAVWQLFHHEFERSFVERPVL